jgi:sucrose-6-phosphate hydrolase SacC (GH32 family)
MTLPRVLSLDDENNLIIEPVEELKSLRTENIQKKNIVINDSELRLDGVQGNTLELKLKIKSTGNHEYGIKICSSPNGEEETSISYSPAENKLKVDLTKTSLDQNLMSGFYEANGLLQEADLELNEAEILELHIFIDRSVLEVFVNNKLCLTHRIYPTREDSQGVVLFSKGGEVEVPELQAWKLHPSNPW